MGKDSCLVTRYKMGLQVMWGGSPSVLVMQVFAKATLTGAVGDPLTALLGIRWVNK